MRIGRKWQSGNEAWVAARAGTRGAGERMGAEQRKVVREGLVCLPGALPAWDRTAAGALPTAALTPGPWGPSLCL